MARLRHFAVCVSDPDKATAFYQSVFDLKRIAREDLEIGSAIYMSDGAINLALLNFKGSQGCKTSDLTSPGEFVGAHHFGFQVDDLAETQKRIEVAGGGSSLILATSGRETSSGSSKIPMAQSSTFQNTAGREPTDTERNN